MENNSLIAALRKAENEKFSAVPSEEKINHDFSDRFQKKMDRLIRAQRQPGWSMIKTPARRSFLLLLILLITFGVRPEQNPLFRMAQSIPQLSTAVPAVSATDTFSHRNNDAGGLSARSAAFAQAHTEQDSLSANNAPSEHASSQKKTAAAAAPAVETTTRQSAPGPEGPTAQIPAQTDSEAPTQESKTTSSEGERSSDDSHIQTRPADPETETAPTAQEKRPVYIPLSTPSQTEATSEEELPPGYTPPTVLPPLALRDTENAGNGDAPLFSVRQNDTQEYPTVVLDPRALLP